MAKHELGAVLLKRVVLFNILVELTKVIFDLKGWPQHS